MPLTQWIKIGFPCSATEWSPQDNVSNENVVIPFKIIPLCEHSDNSNKLEEKAQDFEKYNILLSC